MDDLINRQAAIEICLKYNGVGWVWSQILDEIEKTCHPQMPFQYGMDIGKSAKC